MFRPIDALNILCTQLMRDLFVIAKFLSSLRRELIKPHFHFLIFSYHCFSASIHF